MSEKILVFGALGRVGSAIIQALPGDVEIRAADIVKGESCPDNVESVIFDFNSPPDDLTTIFEGIASMFLLWPPGVKVGEAIPPIIQAAAKRGVKKVVFLSILGADKLKVVPHRSVERMLEESGMDWVFLRSAYFMQNLSGIHAPEIKESGEIFIPAGFGTLGMIDVRDVGEVGAKALMGEHKNVAYSPTGPEGLTFIDVAEAFSKGLDRPIKYTNPTVLKFFRHMKRRGIPTGLIIFMIIEYTATKLGKSDLVTNQVEKILGRPPRTIHKFILEAASVWQ
jgi:uncharacterized protein YbjT (DUF2867 family)